jgi:hypothetical protein
MCIKIICSDHEHEFSASNPLEQQLVGAKEVIVSYDPIDPKIESFVNEMQRFCDNGISCDVFISVKSNNHLNGFKLERKIEKLKRKLDFNEVTKKLVKFQAEADRKLKELSEMCGEK